MKTCLLLIAALLTFGTCTAASAETKIATIDMRRILTEPKAAKAKREEIDNGMESAKRKIEEKQKALMDLQEKLADSKDPKSLDKFDKDRRELDRFVQDSREEFGRQIDKVTKDLAAKSMSIIQGYAKTNDIDIVIDKSEQFKSPVLYGESRIDITQAVLDQMDK